MKKRTKKKLKERFLNLFGIVKGKNKLATYKHKCKKCGYGKSEVIDLGASYSDENNTYLLKCGKCGYSERVD